MYNQLCETLSEIKEMIKEHKDEMDDFETHCQIILKADSGLSMSEFKELLQQAINLEKSGFRRKVILDGGELQRMTSLLDKIENTRV
jgi:hypothetical protein